MEIGKVETIQLLTYLLPGFVAAWVFYGLTSHPKPSPFERAVLALILTVIVQAAVVPIREVALSVGRLVTPLGEWSHDSTVVASVLVAFGLGLLMARFANNNAVHRLLRSWHFTMESAFPSEWFRAFAENAENPTYVVLHLEGHRRLYGWPEQWPSAPDSGHFAIAEAEWLDGDQRIPLSLVEHILVPASQVEMVEFVRLPEINIGVQANGQRAGSPAQPPAQTNP